jgi:NAD(P)-dependent dehydrogenase (short-subunit alcohol dehydrogenase family)
MELWDPYAGLHGQVAIVTGAGRGLGKAIALGLAQAGTDVVLAARTVAECERVADAVRELGQRALALRTDVTRRDDCIGMVAATLEEFGRLDILVNNAGISVAKAALDVDEEDVERVTATNFKGLFFCCQAAARAMIQGDGGRIINIASTAGHLIRPGVPPVAVYGATKAAVIHLTRALAVEWVDYGIRVNAIAPGFFASPANEQMRSDPALLAAYMLTTPMGRVGAGADIVGPVLFLASDASAFMTGQTLFVDGGRTIL